MPTCAGAGAGARPVRPATLAAPVLVYCGELDLGPTPAEAKLIADAFPHARLVVQPGAAHYPWLDDADDFRETVAAFLD